MRHLLGLRKLNRTSAHRLAMLRNMSVSLLRHETIRTTLPKAKELRRVVEPIITLGKKPSLANRRLAFNRLRDREIVVKLFDQLGPRYASRNGGYLRILKCGFRDGDNAPMAFVELLDQPEEAESSAEEERSPDGEQGKTRLRPGFFWPEISFLRRPRRNLPSPPRHGKSGFIALPTVFLPCSSRASWFGRFF